MGLRWNEIGRIARENGERRCRVVNSEGKKDARCNGKYEQAHHGCFPAEARGRTDKASRMFLDSPFNFCPACIPCNVSHRVGDPEEARIHFFRAQVKKYGVAQMRGWMNTAPQDIQDRHEYKRMMATLEESDGQS